MKTLRSGHTLTEILIVVIVLGVLASVTIPLFITTVERCRGAEAREILYKSYAGFQKRLEDGEPIKPLTWGMMGMSDPNLIPIASRNFNYSITNNLLGNPTGIRATRKNNAAARIEINLYSGVVTNTSPF